VTRPGSRPEPSPPPGTIAVRTYAKVNLWLRVLGRRGDGYHDIESVFHGIGLGDDLVIAASSEASVRVETVLGPGVSGPAPVASENLAARAALELASAYGRRPGLDITIHKRIPVAGGLGGGSANAAGTLVALDRLWGLDSGPAGLGPLAARLGSDVPYFIAGGSALATSRGEVLAPVDAPVPLWLVLGFSAEPLLTRAVYAAVTSFDRGPGAEAMVAALGSGDAGRVGELVHNGLQPAVFRLRPRLRDRVAAMRRAGALGAAVSGSGPTVFGVARDRAHATEIAARLSGVFSRLAIVLSQPRAIEPLDPSHAGVD
jgi:4-diphosphocytidyl-2-C-methyl-D-erythritol kinase